MNLTPTGGQGFGKRYDGSACVRQRVFEFFQRLENPSDQSVGAGDRATVLTVPFTQRFGTLDDRARAVYFAAVITAATSSILLIAPTVHHRMRFRKGTKEQMLYVASQDGQVVALPTRPSSGSAPEEAEWSTRRHPKLSRSHWRMSRARIYSCADRRWTTGIHART